MSNVYNVGDVAVITWRFSALTDVTTSPVTRVVTTPTAATLTIASPSGTVTTQAYPGTITTPATGMLRSDVPCTEIGTWSASIASSGAAVGAERITWTVLP